MFYEYERIHFNFDHSSLHAPIMICTTFEISIIKSKPDIQEILSKTYDINHTI